MPTLNWIGKEAVVNHDKEVPFRLLKKIKSYSARNTSQNLIIHGDNLEALKALMPYYQGRVKCIYIDPPYNTGNEDWVYNDKVNSPKIKKWLGKVVGKESEDLTRHDKWLCMMYPRLKLLRDLLSDDGAIFISIDDNEQANLKQLADEIFGEINFITTIIWQKKYSPQNDAKYFSDMHDFVVVYAKHRNVGDEKIGWIRSMIPRTQEQDARYKNPDNDPRGPWKPADFSVKTYSEAYDYEIITPSGRKVNPPKGRCWATSKENFEEWKKDNRIWFGKSGNNVPAEKKFLSEVQAGVVPLTIWLYDDVGHTDEARKELKTLFNEITQPFDNPKPTRLIKQILRLVGGTDFLVLDSFAGSGTTGQAVLDLNKEDNGNRRFVLVEMEDNVAKAITVERLKRSIKKYGYVGGFEYCELDKPLFNQNGQIEEECSFGQLATYIYFTETNTNLDPKTINNPFIGEYNETEFYLLFQERGKNILNKDFLKKISKSEKKKVIYADKCFIDEKILEKRRIQFKQIPYEVKVY